MKLQLKNLSCGYGNYKVVEDIDLEISLGEALCILGPNGAGKSTLFKTILGLIKPMEGEVLVNGRNIFQIERRELAKIIAYVPQAHREPFPYSVLDIVLMGRSPYIGTFSSPKSKDKAVAKNVLQRLNISHLMDKVYTEISGGEKQLTLIARALAQEPEVLIMDEPTSNLDFGNQIRVLEHIDYLVKESNIALVMTSHNPNHALICSSKVALMDKGKIIKFGNRDEVLTGENLKELYKINNKYLNFLGGNNNYEKDV